MLGGGQMALQPVFIDSPSGRLFGVYHRHDRSAAAREAVLFVPPFAEEMNRSRRMAALQASAFAAAGRDVLLLDLFGTGDSAGDFGDARLSLWLDDIGAALDWLAAQGAASISLWGLRLGGLLAAMVAQARPDRIERLLLWQPVIDGKAMLTQFLRIRVAAAMADGGPAEKTEELRAQLAAGTAIEVAGYALAPQLAEALDGLRLDRVTLAPQMAVHWLELGAEPGDRLLPASERVVEAWRKADIGVKTATVSGDPFWTLQETTLATELIAATMRQVSA